MEKVKFKDVSIKYESAVREAFGFTRITEYDLELTCKIDLVNTLTRRVLLKVQPYEPVFWEENGDGTATAVMYGLGEYTLNAILNTLTLWHTN